MSIKINGTTISGVNLNGSELMKISLNGTTIYEGIPPYYNELKNGVTLTESQWLAFLNGGGIKYIIDKGETSTFLRKKVILTNSADSTYTTWSIGDFNHDNTNDTCDLILDNSIHNIIFGSSRLYSSSNARAWLKGTYYNGFSTDIKNKLQTMSVVSNGNTLSDKVKLLSVTEVGASFTQALVEGTKYPIFASSNIANITRIRTGANDYWWLRSRYTSGTNYVFLVYTDGSINSVSYSTTSFGLVPCIRFA